MVTFLASMFSESAFASVHLNPEMQSFSPPGNADNSLTSEGTIEFLNSTITTATFFAAIIFPHAR